MDEGLGNSVNAFMTPGEALICGQYLVDLDPEKTAERCSVTLREVRTVLAKFQALLQARVAEKTQKVGITVERVLEEIACLAFFDPLDLFDEHGLRRPLNELSEPVRRAVGIEFAEGSSARGPFDSQMIKYTAADKRAALELAGKYLKMFTDRVEVSGIGELADRISRARERMASHDAGGDGGVRGGPGGGDRALSPPDPGGGRL